MNDNATLLNTNYCQPLHSLPIGLMVLAACQREAALQSFLLESLISLITVFLHKLFRVS